MPGVVRTRVGYAGGSKKNPSYYSLGDNSETIEIDYDPARVAYQDLLNIFWEEHNPARRPWSKQYASIIFYHSQEQKQLAVRTKAREESRRGGRVYTEILPFNVFYPAEDYHQKHRLRGEERLCREYEAIYPDSTRLTASTAAARVNGYLDGYGTVEEVESELKGLGLSPQGGKLLMSIVSSTRRQHAGCPL